MDCYRSVTHGNLHPSQAPKYGVRRQAKRDAAFPGKPATLSKAASRFAWRRTPYRNHASSSFPVKKSKRLVAAEVTRLKNWEKYKTSENIRASLPRLLHF